MFACSGKHTMFTTLTFSFAFVKDAVREDFTVFATDVRLDYFLHMLTCMFIITFHFNTHVGIHWHKLGCPSLSEKCQSLLICVSGIRSYQDDDNKVQILTRNSRHLTFFLKYFHDYSLTQVGLPIFEWEMLKPFIHLWVEKIVLVSVILDLTVDF